MADGKANPRKVNFPSSGTSAVNQLSLELFHVRRAGFGGGNAGRDPGNWRSCGFGAQPCRRIGHVG